MAVTAWYDPAWRHRIKVTIDHTKVSATLTNYPWYVSGADIETAIPNFWDYVESTTGDDFLWTLADGTTKIPHDMPHFSNGVGFESHALIASLSHATDTERYLYWGNRNAADQRNAAGTFTGHIARWGMGQASGNLLDSLGAWNGTPTGVTQGATGKLYPTGGASYNGTSSAVLLPGGITAAHSGHAGTAFSCWYKRAATGVGMRLYHEVLDAATNLRILGEFVDTDALRLYVRAENGGTIRSVTTVSTFTDTTAWHHLVFVADIANDRLLVYHDGVLNESAAAAFTPTTFDATQGPRARLGAGGGGTASLWFNGLLDECRLLASVPTAERVATEFANQSAPSTFHSFEALETYPGRNLGQHWLMRWPFRS